MNNAALLASLQKRQQGGGPPKAPLKPVQPSSSLSKGSGAATTPKCPPGKVFHYDETLETFLLDLSNETPTFVPDEQGNVDTDINIPLAPCVYRLCDYTLAKQEPIALQRCLLKLGVLRCLQRECTVINKLLWHRLSPTTPPASLATSATENAPTSLPTVPSLDGSTSTSTHPTPTASAGGTVEEEELGKVRFMELLSNCGVYQRVSEMILQSCGRVVDDIRRQQDKKLPSAHNNNSNPYRIPQIKVQGLDDFLQAIEALAPALAQARQEIDETQTVSFFPGLGELFTPGSKLVCFPDGMEGVPMGVSCVQSWYAEEHNKATNKTKKRFVLVVEFVVSVGTELVFVAASEVYPEFHDASRNMPIKDLTHRRLLPDSHPKDAGLLHRLQERGLFYASVATSNYYLQYHPNNFFPIIGGGWSNNAVRPLSKGGRVMIDIKRGILENHLPIRGTGDGMSDTVKEAIKLFESNKRTGIAVPFRTAILPAELTNDKSVSISTSTSSVSQPMDDFSDRPHLWMSWPCLVGFSFTARVWGKLLLTLPKSSPPSTSPSLTTSSHSMATEKEEPESPRRASAVKLGVRRAGLGGVGKCGSCGFIHFQEKAFEQLVLDEDKKELIRAVARNAGGGTHFDDEYDDMEKDDDDDNAEEMGLDVVANKGAASIFLLSGGPGTGKTLTAEAIAELLRKPLYVVTAGDLGITAAEVEKSLGSVLELCQTWDALVLIDEADIFLEARNSHEIQRNALVCVMLRLLEYYSGCLFLSSNRAASSIDAAIASRITVMLTYPALDATGRAKVWKNLVELVPALPVDSATNKTPDTILSNPRKASKYRTRFTGEDYSTLAASYYINGRQIKNSIVLARALARERGSPLSLSILQRAVTAVAGEANGSDSTNSPSKTSGGSY